MKKRTKLMLGLSAMLLAAGGVAATGTFAWFAATAPTITPTTAGQTGSITSVAGFTSVNGFTVAVDAASLTSITSVLLTNTSGDVYSTLSDGGADILMPGATGTKIATVSPTVTITYTGSASTAAEVETLWDAAIAAHPIDLTISDVTDYTADGQSGTHFSNALVARAGTGGKVMGTDYGLKFTSGASNYTHNAENAVKPLAVAATVGFTDPTGTGNGRTTSKSVASGVSFYVGIVGIDGVVQDADDTYTLKVAPGNHV